VVFAIEQNRKSMITYLFLFLMKQLNQEKLDIGEGCVFVALLLSGSVLLPHQVCQVSEERNATFDQSFGI
jgi:hypothetical protein